MSRSAFFLRPIPPFRLDLTVWVLRRLPINAMDRWDGQTYRRVLMLEETPVEVAVTQAGSMTKPKLQVSMDGCRATAKNKTTVAAELEKMLGLRIDLAEFQRLASRSKALAALVRRFVGLKPPRLPSVYEALLNGISCQQLSLTVGIHLLNRLSFNYGRAFHTSHAFPRPKDLAHARTTDLKKLGYSGRKAEYIINLTHACLDGTLDLESFSALDDLSIQDCLQKIPGVGRWTAQYALLRGLGRLDVFPADDIGSQNKLQRWFKLKRRPSYEGMHRVIDPWSPYRGLIYFYLLLDHLSRQNLIKSR